MITAGFNYVCDNVDYSDDPNALRVGCNLYCKLYTYMHNYILFCKILMVFQYKQSA